MSRMAGHYIKCYNPRVELHFLYALFLYLLGILLAFAENRTELKLAGPASRFSYLAGSGVTLAVLIGTVHANGGRWEPDFFAGTLLSLVLLAVVYLVARCFGRIPWGPAVFSAVSLFLGAMAVLRGRPDEAVRAAQDWTRFTGSHIICMFIALAAFTLSFIFSVLFLTQDRLLKRKSVSALVSALPPLELTSRLNFASITVGTAALAMGVFGGTAALAKLSNAGEVVRDPSVILSVLMLALYTALAALRRGALERARTVSVVSIMFYFLLLFVFWGAHAHA
jgi:ABC-type uncharacterized transport system permease subunit